MMNFFRKWDCFSNVTLYNTDSIENGDSLLSAEASGLGELAPLTMINSIALAGIDQHTG